MPMYKVTLHETVVHVFELEADNEQDAEWEADDAFRGGDPHFQSSAECNWIETQEM